jgi:hypothetical protein
MNLKKWITVLLGAILTISLTACGQDETTNGTGNAADPQGSAAATEAPAGTSGDTSKGVPTVDELIQKSTEASQALTSFAMKSTIAQNISMTQGETSQDQKINMNMTSEFIKDPMQMHQEILMDMGDQGEQKIEQYITADGMFTKTGEHG